MNKPSIIICAAVAALALGALIVIPLATARGESATATTVKVKGGEFFFRFSTQTIPAPGAVTFVFTNVGHVAHNFKVAGKLTPLVAPGKTANFVVTFKTKGTYPYLCTVPGHAAAGMKGTLTVR